MPMLFVLENVQGILRTAAFIFLMKHLDSLKRRGYDIVILKKLCPTSYGHKMRRPRVYIVGSLRPGKYFEKLVIASFSILFLRTPKVCCIRWVYKSGRWDNIIFGARKQKRENLHCIMNHLRVPMTSTSCVEWLRNLGLPVNPAPAPHGDALKCTCHLDAVCEVQLFLNLPIPTCNSRELWVGLCC